MATCPGAGRGVRGGGVLGDAAQTEAAIAKREHGAVPLEVRRAEAGELLEAPADMPVEGAQLRVMRPVLDDARGEGELPERGAVAQQAQRNLRVAQQRELVEPSLTPLRPTPDTPRTSLRTPLTHTDTPQTHSSAIGV